MQIVDLYCKKCKCSTKVSYALSGDARTPVLTGVIIKCHTCKRVMVLKNFTEGEVVARTTKVGKLFI